MEANIPQTGGRMPLTDAQKAERKARRKAARAARAAAAGQPQEAMVIVPSQGRPRRGVSLVSIPRGQQLLVGRGAYDYTRNGRAIGQDLGGMAGEAMGSVVSRLLGRGAYTLRRNSVMSSSNAMPRFRQITDGFEITQREFLLDVVATGSTNWAITSTSNINPGLAGVFTFLNQLAIAFEEYEFDQAVIVYEPSSGSVSTTQGLGTVMIASQYDLQDIPFLTQTEMLDYEYATVNRPDQPMIHPLECDPRQNQLARFYVRSGLLAGTTSAVDPRYNAYDLCKVNVAIAGVPASAGVVLGKLFISYTCKFFKPKLYGGLAAYQMLHDYFSIVYTVTAGVFSAPVGPTFTTGSNVGSTAVLAGNNLNYTFPVLNGATFDVFFSFTTTGSVNAPSCTSSYGLGGGASAISPLFQTGSTGTTLTSAVSTSGVRLGTTAGTLSFNPGSIIGVCTGTGTLTVTIGIFQVTSSTL